MRFGKYELLATLGQGGMAQVFLAGPEPIDLSRESNGNLALAFDVRLEEAPSSAVTLSMGCGESCFGALDLTDTLAAMPVGEWQ